MKIPQSRFQALSPDLLETVRRWRNLPRIRKNMLTGHEITEAEQAGWFAGLGQDRTRLYFVYFQDDLPTGMLYFTDITGVECSWGCYLGLEAVWPGSGLVLEIAALDFAFARLELNTLRAEVFEYNTAAKRMHELFEYQFDGLSTQSYQREDGAYRLLKYSYRQQDWSAQRARILEKLPRQIQAAAGNITFVT